MSRFVFFRSPCSCKISVMAPKAIQFVPMVHAIDLRRTIDFYSLLGFESTGKQNDSDGKLIWTWLRCGDCHVMFSRADGPIDETKQGVMFYLYTENIIAMREHLIAHFVQCSEIKCPFYMPQGEMTVTDPDGYCLIIAQGN